MDTKIFIKISLIIWLLICAWEDLKKGEVSNWLTIPPLVFAAFLVVYTRDNLVMFFSTLAILVLFYYLNALGGADVKILLALVGLWPVGFWGALIVQGIWGFILMLRKGKKAEFRAVPSFAIGALLVFFLMIFINARTNL